MKVNVNTNAETITLLEYDIKCLEYIYIYKIYCSKHLHYLTPLKSLYIVNSPASPTTNAKAQILFIPLNISTEREEGTKTEEIYKNTHAKTHTHKR